MTEAKIQRIFKHYGEQSQLIKTQEELKERRGDSETYRSAQR